MQSANLLNHRDPDPVLKGGIGLTQGAFLMVGDHAGCAVPAALGALGLPGREFERHIAIDLGLEALGKALSERLGAPFVRQAYSRLVCDCNRAPDHPGWMPEISDGTVIPGNRGVDETERAARREEIFEPYHRAIGAALDRREGAGAETVFLSLHSFTPAMAGEARPWEIGILHDGREDGFALAALEWLRANSGRVIGDNEPYKMDETDYTVARHAYPRGMRYLELEVRQDILSGEGFAPMADLLAECFLACR